MRYVRYAGVTYTALPQLNKVLRLQGFFKVPYSFIFGKLRILCNTLPPAGSFVSTNYLNDK